MSVYFSSAIKGYVASFSGLEKHCWQGIILNLIESTLIGIYYFLPLYFVNVLGFQVVQAGVIISFFGFGALLGGFFGGKLSDKTTPGLVSIGSLVIQALVLLAFTRHGSFEILCFDVFFMGLASYGFITSIHLWVLNQCQNCETKKLQAINLLNVFSNIGLSISAIIVSFFADRGFQSIFAISSCLLFLSAIYFSFIERKVLQTRVMPISASGIPDKFDESVRVYDKKIVIVVLTCLFLVGLIIFQSSTYAIYIKETFPKCGVKGVGVLFALNCVLIIVFQSYVVDFFSKYNKIVMVGLGAFLIGFGMLMLNFSLLFEVAIIGCIINTIGEMLFFSIAQFICYQSASSENKGQQLGIYRMVYAASRIMAPAAGGYIYQQYGASIVWTLCGLIGLLCLGACYHIKNLCLEKS